jgi:hypothetical protein
VRIESSKLNVAYQLIRCGSGYTHLYHPERCIPTNCCRMPSKHARMLNLAAACATIPRIFQFYSKFCPLERQFVSKLIQRRKWPKNCILPIKAFTKASSVTRVSISLLTEVKQTDPMAKPEMIVSISKCEVLVGFRSIQEMAEVVSYISPLRDLLGDRVSRRLYMLAESSRNLQVTQEPNGIPIIRHAFETLLGRDSSFVAEACRQLNDFLDNHRYSDGVQLPKSVLGAIQVARKLSDEHPGDIGIFLALLMNYTKMDPGESLFIPAGVIHAYMSGGKKFSVNL